MSAQIILCSLAEDLPYVGTKSRGSGLAAMTFLQSRFFWSRTLFGKDITEPFPEAGMITNYTSTNTKSTKQTVDGTNYYPCITVFFNEADNDADITLAADVVNYYPKDKMTIVFPKGQRPPFNGVGTRVYYKDGNTLRNALRDASTYSKLGGRDTIIVDTSGYSNIYKVDIIFYLTAKASSYLRVEQIILGEAYDFNDFDSYEVTEQCAYLMDDMPYNVLTAELRADEDVKLIKGMTAINRINGNPYGVFKVSSLKQTDKTQWELTANDASARLEGLNFDGAVYGGNSVLIDSNMSFFFRFFKYNTGVDIYENFKEDPVNLYTDSFSVDSQELTSRGYCDIMTYRKALLMHTQATGSMLKTDRYGRMRFRNLPSENGLNFYYTKEPDYVFDSSKIMGDALFEDLPKCRKISFKLYDLVYEHCDEEKSKVATVYLPPYNSGKATVIMNECFTANPELYLKDTSTRVTYDSWSEDIVHLGSSPLKRDFWSNNSDFKGGEVDVYYWLNKPQILGEDIDIYKDGEYDYVVDNTLCSSLLTDEELRGYDYIRATELANWIEHAIRSPGIITAQIICEDNNVPQLGDTLQVETAWQGIKQGMLTRITVGSEDTTVADVEIVCFPETNRGGREDDIFADLNGR